MSKLRLMYVGGVWGDYIGYVDDKHTKIYGFKSPTYNAFSEGSALFDLCHNKYNDTIPLYLITNITRPDSPRDQFFADIDLIANVKNPCIVGDYPKDWYKPYCNEILEDYKEKLHKLPFYKFSEKKRLKMIVRILNLMQG